MGRNINKTLNDCIDNRDALANRKVPVTKQHIQAGSTKGKTEIFLRDHCNTIIYASKKKDPEVVEFTYRRHLRLDTTGLKPPPHMINGIEPELNLEDVVCLED